MHKSFEILLINISTVRLSNSASDAIRRLLYYTKNSLSSPCTSQHKHEQKDKTKTLVKFPDHVFIDTGRNVRFACLQIYCKSCYKFQICNDLPHLHACKLLICTRGKLGGKCGNGREAVRRKSVANPLQNNYFATSLHACKFHANTKFASDLHIHKSVDYIKLANGL